MAGLNYWVIKKAIVSSASSFLLFPGDGVFKLRARSLRSKENFSGITNYCMISGLSSQTIGHYTFKTLLM